MPEPITLVFDLGGKVRVSPNLFINNKIEVQPGDLSKFAPFGNGVYGYQEPLALNPLTQAPPHEDAAGIIYFGNQIEEPDFTTLLKIMDVKSTDKDYAVFLEEAKFPETAGYLVQIRIVTRFGLSCLFDALPDSEYESFPNQELTVQETLWTLINKEKERWGTSCFENKGLYGKFGGDGDFAKEELSFGFMVENSYFGVYRLWSRAWLVTK